MYIYGGTLVPDGIEPDAIVAADRYFRRDDFLAFARTVHRNVHQAAAGGDPRTVQAVLGEPMRSSLPGRRRDGSWTAPVERLDHIAILEATHAAVDRIHVRFGAVIAGRQTVEDWIFERSADAYAHLSGVVPAGCASCGAPLVTDDQGDCRYCGTHVLGVAGNWQVVDVVAPRLVEAAKGPSRSDALGPEHGQEDLLAFVRSIYLNVHKACGEGKLSTIRDVLTSGMRDSIASDPEAHCWGVPILRVDAMDIVGVQRGALDVITVRIQAVTEGGPFVEDWTFERPASLPGARPPGFNSCSFCGAGPTLDQRGNCMYCGTHLLGVAGDWRLSRAVQPTAMATHPAVVRALQSKTGQLGCVLFVVIGLAITAALLVGVFVYLTP